MKNFIDVTVRVVVPLELEAGDAAAMVNMLIEEALRERSNNLIEYGYRGQEEYAEEARRVLECDFRVIASHSVW